jgi:glutathione S-transferase
MSGQGPYFGQKNWFSMFHPEKIPSAIERYANEVVRITGVIDAHLEKRGTEYLVGDRITYADLMFFVYFRMMPTFIAPEIDLSGFKAYTAWFGRLLARPAVAKVDAHWTEVAVAALATRKAEQGN